MTEYKWTEDTNVIVKTMFEKYWKLLLYRFFFEYIFVNLNHVEYFVQLRLILSIYILSKQTVIL